MNKNCVFSICAKNYIPLARLLGESILSKSDNLDFFIIVADEIENKSELKNNEFMARHVLHFDEKKWNSLAFKYDVTEFCTFLKPYIFDYFFNTYDNVFYLDPDIYFYDSFNIILKELDDCEFLLTPHISYIENIQTDHIQIEDELRGSGLFNFGFLGLKKTLNTISFINWWKTKLFDKCYRDGINYLYTDQVWGNYILTYFDLSKIKVIKHLGWNLAPWNYSERQVLCIDDKLYVKKRESEEDLQPIIFVHYSGYNYKSLCDGLVEQHNDGHEYVYDDISIIFNAYKDVLAKNKEKLVKGLEQKYSYNYFSNGVEVQLFHRRLYRGLLIMGEDIGNPFDSGNATFYLKLKKAKLLFGNNPVSQAKSASLISRKKLKIINKFMQIAYKLLGVKKYISLMKFFKGYGQFENQLHLLDHKYNSLWYRKIIIGID